MSAPAVSQIINMNSSTNLKRLGFQEPDRSIISRRRASEYASQRQAGDAELVLQSFASEPTPRGLAAWLSKQWRIWLSERWAVADAEFAMTQGVRYLVPGKLAFVSVPNKELKFLKERLSTQYGMHR